MKRWQDLSASKGGDNPAESPITPGEKPVAVEKATLGALAFWAGCALAFLYGTELFAAVFAVCALCGLAAALWATKGHPFRNFPLCVASGLLLGTLVGCGGAWALSGAQQDFLAGEDESVQGTLVLSEDASTSSYSSYAEGYLFREGALFPQKVRVYFSDSQVHFFGQVFTGTFATSSFSSAAQASAWRKGLVGCVTVKSNVDYSWATPFAARRAAFVNKLESEGAQGADACLLEALACGYKKSLVETSCYTDFQVAGLAHLVAVSGAHLAIVVALVERFLSFLGIKRSRRAALQGAFILVFLVVCAMPVSALRAAFMIGLALCSFSAHRRADSQRALSACVVLFLVLDPSTALSASFALSALSTFGIVLFAAPITKWLKGLMGNKATALAQTLGVTFAASVATAPLGAALFAQTSLVSPLSNVLSALLFTPATVVSVVAGAWDFVGLPGEGVLLAAARALCSLLAFLAQELAKIPFAAIPCSLPVPAALAVSALAAFCLYRGWLRLVSLQKLLAAAGAAFFVACLAVALQEVSPVRLTMLDVGQGDAILIQDGRAAFLIDTGNQDTLLKQGLASQGVTHLDAVFISHPDDDHCGALATLLAVVEVDKVVVAQPLPSCECDNCQGLLAVIQEAGCQMETLEPGDSVQSNRASFETLWPYEYNDEGGNSDSLCLLLNVDDNADEIFDYRCLLVGDAEGDTLDALVEQGLSSVDVFKVGHHGSKASCEGDALQTLSPEVSLISVGENNRYGHPTEEALDALNAAGSAVYRTDQQGAIQCSFANDGIHVRTLG